MRKIFTLAAALLASWSLMANYAPTEEEVIILNEVYSSSTETSSSHDAIAWAASGASTNSKKAGDPYNHGESTSSNVPCYSVKGNGGKKNITISVEECSKVIVYHEKNSSRFLELKNNDEVIATGEADTWFTEVELDEAEAYSILLHGTDSESKDQDFYVYAIKLFPATGIAPTDPVLKVNPAEVELNASAKNPVASATVVFSGKNLEPGNYALTVPDLLGLGIEPTVVEVGENGKLNAEVTLSFSSAEDVEAASTAISLTIGELTQEVTIHYSAAMTVVKNFLNTSLNIEQWVLDNGKNNAAFQEVLRAANVDFENINELDSLNSSKTADNEPYLGLKLKKAGAYVACWIKAGDRIALKFGALKDAVKIGVNGEYRELPANDNGGDVIEHTAEVDEYIEVVTKSDKTIVIKQIMLNQDIQPVVLPTEGIEDVEASAIRSQKVFRNGHLLIEKNGVIYNAQGTIVK